MKHPDIINAIETHARDFNLKPSSIGQMAVMNGRLYENLKRGADIQIGTAERLMKWMAAYREAKIAAGVDHADAPEASN